MKTELRRTVDLLGGPKVLGRRVKTLLDVHDLLSEGLPIRALACLFEQLGAHHRAGLLKRAVGTTIHMGNRRRATQSKRLNRTRSNRAWVFAEVLTNAADVFGSQENAENWLIQPAMGLQLRCPVDLLPTPVGLKLVEDHLERLQYGVFT